MKIVCCYFSGTGNTRRACEALARELGEKGHTVSLFPIRRDAETPPLEGHDCLIVGFPVHGFNAPAPVLKFLKGLKKTSFSTPCYILRTSGEPLRLNNASSVTPKRILRRRGYKVYGELWYVLPYNIIFRHSDGMAARMQQDMERMLPIDAARIGALETSRRRAGPLARFVSLVCRVEHTAMPLIGRRYKTTEKCLGCGKCAEVCPQKNIKICDGKPVFGKECVGCMGCVFSCPADAIRPSLFNGWRVNGAYSFDAPPATDDEICKYCRKAYLRYFRECEKE